MYCQVWRWLDGNKLKCEAEEHDECSGPPENECAPYITQNQNDCYSIIRFRLKLEHDQSNYSRSDQASYKQPPIGPIHLVESRVAEVEFDRDQNLGDHSKGLDDGPRNRVFVTVRAQRREKKIRGCVEEDEPEKGRQIVQQPR